MEKIIEIPQEFKRLFDSNWREAAIYGGRYSLKSHTVARYLLVQARMGKTRIGCFREFQNSIADSSHQLLADLIKLYELTDFQVTNNSIVNQLTGSDFIFKGLWQNDQSIKSIEGIDIAWVEEAQTVSDSSLEVLTPTVRKPRSKIIYTYNRLLEDDAVHKRLVIDGRPNTLIINVNYDIAIKYGMLPQVILEEIEDDKKKRPFLYKHKWLGEPSSSERKIYKDWQIIDVVPHEARLERRGLDFGYSVDPTAVVSLYYYNGGYILDEEVYRKGLLNKPTADLLNNLTNPEVTVIADSAEPKSIDELKLYGVNILPAMKGPGSIATGIKFVQAQKISATSRSTNLIKEYKAYLWKQDPKTNKILTDPEQGMDHCFAPETLIHTTKGKIRIDELVDKEGYLYSRDGRIERFHSVRQTRIKSDMVSLIFNDGNILTVTPDHLLLKPNGEWIEAGLLNKLDMIQCDIYETNTRIQWKDIYSALWRKVFQPWAKTITSGSLGALQWAYSKGLSHTSQRPRYSQQQNRELRTETQDSSFKRPHDSSKEGKAKEMGRKDKTTNKEVAWIKRGKGMAQVTWSEDVCEKRSYFKRLCLLPQDIYYKAVCKVRKILSSELQNESKTKTIVGVARRFCPITYNLEVDNTHCLIANGVVAHNCMDAVRYAFNAVLTPNNYQSGVTVSYHL